MEQTSIDIVRSPEDLADLDELLWNVLWRPLGLSRNIRQELKVDGEAIELISKAGNTAAGCLVAVWTAPEELELRHLAVVPEAHNCGVGRLLVMRLIEIAKKRGCRRLHTIARNTSSTFFRKVGFRRASGAPPDHPVFRKHGITFELMEMVLEPAPEASEPFTSI